MQNYTTAQSLLSSTKESSGVSFASNFPEAYQEHLSLLGLPRGGMKAFKSLDESWLYQDVNWPSGVERRLHRYMHTANLYQVSDAQEKSFSKLLDLFIAASGLSKTSAARKIVIDRCQSLVNSSSQTWKQEGVLVEISGSLRKNPEFEKLWDFEIQKLKLSKSSPEKTPSDVGFGELKMSRCSSASTNRGLSDDSLSGKRNANDDNYSASTESVKRVRRSSSRFTPDDAEDFIVVSSGNRRSKVSHEFKNEDEDFDPVSPSTFDNPKSPAERISIHPDCEISDEVAKKAMEVWNSLRMSPRVAKSTSVLTSGSEQAQEEGVNSTTPSENSSSLDEQRRRGSITSPRASIGSLAPASNWSPKMGSENLQDVIAGTPALEKPAEKYHVLCSPSSQTQAETEGQISSMLPSLQMQQRSPLPTQRDQNPLQSSAHDKHPPVIQRHEEFRASDSDVVREEIADQTAGNIAHTRASKSPQQVQASISWGEPDVNRGLNSWRSQRPSWDAPGGIPMPQSLSHTAPQSARSVNPNGDSDPKGYPVINKLPGNVSQDAGPFTIFPSAFSVFTTESVKQRNQASVNKPAKRRGRKPANHDNELAQKDAVLPSIVPQPQILQTDSSLKSFVSEDGLPRPKLPLENASIAAFHGQIQTKTAQSGLPAIAVSHGYYRSHQTLPPRPSTTPPPRPSTQRSEAYQPPPIVFTIDNRAESPLLTADVQSFVEKFTQGTRVALIALNTHLNPVHPIGVIMWQNLPDFYKWYSENTNIREIGALRFELTDVHWQSEKSFVVPDGSLHFFRTLKQYIWDLFWIASNLSNATTIFRVTISQFPPRAETASPGSPQATGWNAVNSRMMEMPAQMTTASNLHNIMVVPESRPPAEASPENHLRSLPLPSTHPSSGLSTNIRNINNPEISVYQTNHNSPRKLPPDLPSPTRSPFSPRHEPANSFQQTRQNSDRIISSTGSHAPRGPVQTRPLYSPVDTIRTSWDQAMLRDRARQAIVDRCELEILDQESTVHDKLPYKTGSEVCGAVVDRLSGLGMVTLTGKGYITLNIPTGPDETGDRYKEINIQSKQTCMLHGGAAVLYYRRREPGPPRPPRPPCQPGMAWDQVEDRQRREYPMPPSVPSQQSHPQQMLRREDSQSSGSTYILDIVIRIQIDGTGKFSSPFDKSVLRPKVTTMEFFSWFANQTRRGLPHGPQLLKFTFKDAMPTPRATEIAIGNEDHFSYMRKDIKVQCEKSKAFMPELKEFVVLVTVPGWVSPDVEEDEEW